MGYELHITRKENWFDDGPDIPAPEWQAYVGNDPEMRLTGVAEAALPDGGVLRYESPLMAEWHKPHGGEIVWFDFRDGRVVVKSPDDEIIAKMLQVAAALRARVQGDEGEFYPTQSEARIPPFATTTESRPPLLLRWPLWKQLIAAFLLGCILLALKVLIFE